MIYLIMNFKYFGTHFIQILDFSALWNLNREKQLN